LSLCPSLSLICLLSPILLKTDAFFLGEGNGDEGKAGKKRVEGVGEVQSCELSPLLIFFFFPSISDSKSFDDFVFFLFLLFFLFFSSSSISSNCASISLLSVAL